MGIKWLLVLALSATLLVNAKQIQKRQIPMTGTSSFTCSSGSCPFRSATSTCLPGTPGCALTRFSDFFGGSSYSGLSGQGYSGLSQFTNRQTQLGSLYDGRSSYGQIPIYINRQSNCPFGSPGCRVIQIPSSPQVIQQPPQYHTRAIPYAVPLVVPNVQVIREVMPQPYDVQQVVPVPVNKPVIVPRQVTQVVPREVEVYRDIPYRVSVPTPYEVKEKVYVQVPYKVVVHNNRTSSKLVQDQHNTYTKKDNTDSTLKTDSHGFVNITISVNNTNINDLKESTDMRHDEIVSNQQSEKQKVADNNCCTVIGPNRCESRSSCRRTRYQRCGSFCRSSKVIFLKPRVEPVYVPRPVHVPQPYPVPVPQPMPGSRCFGINSYPYLDCRGSCSSCGVSGGSCSSSCYSDHYSEDFADYEDLENYCETYGGPMC